MSRWTTKGQSSFVVEVTPAVAGKFDKDETENKMCGPYGHHNIDPQEDLHIRFQNYKRTAKGSANIGRADTRRGVANQLAIFGELMKPMVAENEDTIARVTRLRVKIRRIGPIEIARIPDRPKDKHYDMSEVSEEGKKDD